MSCPGPGAILDCVAEGCNFDRLAGRHGFGRRWPSQYESDVILPDGIIHSAHGRFPPDA